MILKLYIIAGVIEQFEAQCTSSNEEFAVFRDYVKNGQ